jgi:hypothetical protein
VGRETNKNRRAKQAETAREKAAAARAEARRSEQRRRAIVVISSVVVVAIVAVVIVIIAINKPGKQTAAGSRVDANPTVVSQVAGVSDATINTVGTGGDTDAPKKVTDTALGKNGKPELLFIGAEFCPFCAAERWPLVQALSRFGTFKNLKQVSSSSTDTDPNTPTFSFYKSSYSSQYLTFQPYEVQTRTSTSLETPPKNLTTIWDKYTDSGQGPSYPFLDYNGQYVQTSQSFDPSILGGSTQLKIAAQLDTASSKFAKAIVGGANVTTATICKLTNNQPSNVCTASGVVKAAKLLGS